MYFMKFLAALALLMAFPAAAQESDQRVSLIHAGHLLSVPGEEFVSEKTIVVFGDRISDIRDGYVGPEEAGQPDAAVIDLKDAYVLPGLIDSHVHFSGELGPNYKIDRVTRNESFVALRGADYAEKTLMAGFTTVRDLSSKGNSVFALRDAIAAGHVAGPRLLVAGNMISATGGHGDFLGFREEINDIYHPSGVCDGADDCMRAVREQVKRGADVIKFAATGGVLSEVASGHKQQLTDAEMKAIVDTGHALGRKVTAHAHGVGGIKAALRAGVDSIEHGTFADSGDAVEFRRADAYLIPTLSASQYVAYLANETDILPPPVREKALIVGPAHHDRFGRLAARGVKIAFGTDSGVSPHGDNAKEFAMMVAQGIAPEDAVAAATAAAADAIGMAAEIGMIEAGKKADIIAVRGNPHDDVTVLESVDFVMKDGKTYKNKR